MKKVIISLLVGVIIGITSQRVKSEVVEVKSYYNNSGNFITDYSDNSQSVVNEAKGIYTFYSSDLGDWGLELNNKKELDNVILTYLELSNQ